MSQGRNIMILKVVGYAEAIVKYYRIENLDAHVWIAHQRYPTKGRVWHPGGAHPFAAINMALVHNGDFANYHSVTEYLKQRNIHPQFLTDTEVAALLFDLLDRTYGYQLEHIIEAMAPTTELDFDRLDRKKREIYRAIQAAHIHGSPDGPWFFIIARNIPQEQTYQLLGITDTAMLRPQVFAFSDGDVQVGVISSEKQAIDAALLSLSREDNRICPIADRYWNARGGSHTDGGAFIFDLKKDGDGRMRMTCVDKFGKPVPMPGGIESYRYQPTVEPDAAKTTVAMKIIGDALITGDPDKLYSAISESIRGWSYDDFHTICKSLVEKANEPESTSLAIDTLTLLNDRKYSVGSKKRSHILNIVRRELDTLFRNLPAIDDTLSLIHI